MWRKPQAPRGRRGARTAKSHKVDCDPFIKSQLARLRLTLRPDVVQIWSRNTQYPSRALPTEIKVESETSQGKSGTSVNFSDSGESGTGRKAPGQRARRGAHTRK